MIIETFTQVTTLCLYSVIDLLVIIIMTQLTLEMFVCLFEAHTKLAMTNAKLNLMSHNIPCLL